MTKIRPRRGNLWVKPAGSEMGQRQEAVEFVTGRVERALLVFRAIMNQRAAVLVDYIAQKAFGSELSQSRVLVQGTDDLSAQQPEVVHVPANGLWGKVRCCQM